MRVWSSDSFRYPLSGRLGRENFLNQGRSLILLQEVTPFPVSVVTSRSGGTQRPHTDASLIMSRSIRGEVKRFAARIAQLFAATPVGLQPDVGDAASELPAALVRLALSRLSPLK